MSKNIIIKANNMSIEFPIFGSTHRSIKRAFVKSTIGGLVEKNSESMITVKAIEQVSFEFFKGDKIGLIGHNGAGKSTLLRALAGVYSPSSGSLNVYGKVVSLLDIASGFDADATGFENITIRGILFGLSVNEIKNKLDSIADFSGLEEYLNMPLRTYSSGMILRLAFAIIANIEADIILMDEWLSVGDTKFQDKATERLNEMVAKSSLLVIASHTKSLIEKVCNRVFILEHGKIIEIEE